MTFLILKIFAYLFVAAFIGAAAGWLFRNLDAQKSEEKANRAAHDAKAKVPQLESLLRGRDEQVVKYKKQLDDAKVVLGEREQAVRQVEQQLRDAEREANRWKQSAEAKGQNQSLDNLDFEAETEVDTDADSGADEIISQLSHEIAALKTALAQAQIRVEDAQARADMAAQNIQSSESIASPEQAQQTAKELEVAEAQWQEKLQLLQGQLERETRKVVELERERELQNKSLKVLHQQLELERHKAAG